MEDPSAANRRSLAVLKNAEEAGAEAIVTACPLCLYNLKKSSGSIPVYYFTDLLCKALGTEE